MRFPERTLRLKGEYVSDAEQWVTAIQAAHDDSDTQQASTHAAHKAEYSRGAAKQVRRAAGCLASCVAGDVCVCVCGVGGGICMTCHGMRHCQ